MGKILTENLKKSLSGVVVRYELLEKRNFRKMILKKSLIDSALLVIYYIADCRRTSVPAKVNTTTQVCYSFILLYIITKNYKLHRFNC